MRLLLRNGRVRLLQRARNVRRLLLLLLRRRRKLATLEAKSVVKDFPLSVVAFAVNLWKCLVNCRINSDVDDIRGPWEDAAGDVTQTDDAVGLWRQRPK